MVLKTASRRREYLTSCLPYKVKVTNIEKQKYDILSLWIVENVQVHECQVPEYHKKGGITFEFLSKKHYEAFKELLSQ